MSRLTGLDLDLYLRKSRKDLEEEKKAAEQGEEYDTLERHRRRLLEIVKKENHNIIKIHDEVVSGEFISERPKIQELIRRVEKGLIDAVLVIDLDRLGRGDMLDQGLLDRAFRYSGTKIITPSEIYDPEDDSWELVFGVKSLLARQELKSITKRLQLGRRDSVLEGRYITKKPPYGYLRDENLKLYPDPNTSWVVKKIFEMMASSDFGRRTVADYLNRKLKVKSSTGGEWEDSIIASIIQNEVYLGHIIWGKYKHNKRNGKYERTKLPKEQWTIKRNAHEPLVSQELFDAANLSYKGRWRPHTNQHRKLANPLAGILKCEFCGKSILYQPRKDRNHALRCTNIACKDYQKGAMLKLVEERVLDGLVELLESVKLPEEEIKKQESNIKPLMLAINKKNDELLGLSKQKSNLHDLLEKGVYSVETFIERQKVLVNREESIKDELKVLKEHLEEEQKLEKAHHEFAPKIKYVLDAYHSTDDIELKNKLLKSVIVKATYLRKKDWVNKDQFVIQLFPRI